MMMSVRPNQSLTQMYSWVLYLYGLAHLPNGDESPNGLLRMKKAMDVTPDTKSKANTVHCKPLEMLCGSRPNDLGTDIIVKEVVVLFQTFEAFICFCCLSEGVCRDLRGLSDWYTHLKVLNCQFDRATTGKGCCVLL